MASAITIIDQNGRIFRWHTSGAPTSYDWKLGDFVIDSVGSFWRCTATGNPGTWASVGNAGALIAASNLSDLASVAAARANLLLASAERVALVDAANIVTDAAAANVFDVTLAGDRTMDAPTNPTDGKRITYRIKQDAVGTRLVTWDAAFRFCTEFVTPVLTAAPASLDSVSFVYNAADAKWDCVSVLHAFA